MNSFVILLRGINVGGKNKILMAELKTFLEKEGFKQVKTIIQSGNIVLQSNLAAQTISQKIEKKLPQYFKLDSKLIRALVLDKIQVKKIIDHKPRSFAEQAEEYHSDIIFLIGIEAKEAIKFFTPKEGVDQIWPGEQVIYFQRLSTQLSKSRLSRIISHPIYQSMTIRNWNTTKKLHEELNKKGQ